MIYLYQLWNICISTCHNPHLWIPFTTQGCEMKCHMLTLQCSSSLLVLWFQSNSDAICNLTFVWTNICQFNCPDCFTCSNLPHLPKCMSLLLILILALMRTSEEIKSPSYDTILCLLIKVTFRLMGHLSHKCLYKIPANHQGENERFFGLCFFNLSSPSKQSGYTIIHDCNH